MLVLSRKVGERILIGDQIAVTIVRVTGGGVRVGIEAPPDMAVLRAEIKPAENSVPATADAAKLPEAVSAKPESGSAKPSVLVKPIPAEVSEGIDPPSEVPPVRKPR